MISLLNILILSGCSQGWSVGGIQITPQDTIKNTVFIEIMAHDSVEHWYANKIYSGENWCYNHNQYETVEIR